MKNSRYIIFNQNETKGQIEAAQSDMTQVEHTIANYFLNNEELTDFSSKRISALLYVSEATLSRFAKKCGFKGYREFIFAYEKDLKEEKNGTVSQCVLGAEYWIYHTSDVDLKFTCPPDHRMDEYTGGYL